MSKQHGTGLISKATMAVIENVLAALCTHSEMDNLMRQYGLENAVVDNKLKKARAYLAFSDWSNRETVENLLQMLTQVFVRLDSRGMLNDSKPAQRAIHVLDDREGIQWTGARLMLPASAALAHSQEVVRKFDLSHLDAEVGRILANVERDPDDTITSAKCLVESACRQVLADFNVSPPSGAEINDLVKSAFEHLHLLPDQVSDKAKGAESVRKTLRSMIAAVNGLAEVRNLYGDPHGKGPGYHGLEPRHARLAATLAGGLATFILETHESRNRTG